DVADWLYPTTCPESLMESATAIEPSASAGSGVRAPPAAMRNACPDSSVPTTCPEALIPVHLPAPTSAAVKADAGATGAAFLHAALPHSARIAIADDRVPMAPHRDLQPAARQCKGTE